MGPTKLCGPTGAPMSLGLQTPTKKLTHLIILLGHLFSRNRYSNFSDLGPSLKQETKIGLLFTRCSVRGVVYVVECTWCSVRGGVYVV